MTPPAHTVNNSQTTMKLKGVFTGCSLFTVWNVGHMVTDKKTKPSDLWGDFLKFFQHDLWTLSEMTHLTSRMKHSLCNILSGFGVTQTSACLLPVVWAIISCLCLTLITYKIQTWFPEFIRSVWSAAQMLRVPCDLCFGIPTAADGVSLTVVFFFYVSHWLCYNVWGK